jgi:hypothetical protein
MGIKDAPSTPLEQFIGRVLRFHNHRGVKPNPPKNLVGRYGKMINLNTGNVIEEPVPLHEYRPSMHHIIQEVDKIGNPVSTPYGKAYPLDSEKKEEIKHPDTDSPFKKDLEKLTVKELKEKLDEKGIDYLSKDTKDELIKKLK